MKLLLYCTKAKPYLYKTEKPMIEKKFGDYHTQLNKAMLTENLNGKIVAECDFEVEKIRKGWGCLNGTRYFRNNMNHYYPDYELEKQSCLSFDEINKYLKGTLNENCGYAIHIKNLHIFDKPRELSNYVTKQCPWAKCSTCKYGKNNILCSTIDTPITKAPQNMMYCYGKNTGERYILISIRPEWLCKILNGEKTIEVRKKVLKEMLK